MEYANISLASVRRSAEEFRRVASGNSFLAADVDTTKLHVIFLTDRSDVTRADTPDPELSLSVEFEMHGREIYLRCPDGMGRTRLTTAYMDARLATTA